MKAKVNIKDVVKKSDIVMKVKVKGVTIYGIRIKIALWLIQWATKILCIKYEGTDEPGR